MEAMEVIPHAEFKISLPFIAAANATVSAQSNPIYNNLAVFIIERNLRQIHPK